MQVHGRTRDPDFHVGESLQAVADARRGFVVQGGIRDDDGIASQFLGILFGVFVDAFAAGFLFAFDDELHVHRQLDPLLDIGLHGFDVGVDLSLVVTGAARVDDVVFDPGLEWRRIPQVQWIHRLHVVVAVEEQGLAVGPDLGFSIDQRMAAQVEDLDRQAQFFQLVGDKGGRAPGVLVVVALGTDARYLEKFDQLVDVFGAVAVQVAQDFFTGHGRLLLVAFGCLRAVYGISR